MRYRCNDGGVSSLGLVPSRKQNVPKIFGERFPLYGCFCWDKKEQF